MRNNAFTSEISLDIDALSFNIKFLKNEMGPDVLVSSVVKGNAYGHGIETFVPMAEECGINHFSVFSGEEAIRVKKCLKTDASLMIMGYTSETQLEWAIDQGIEFFVSDVQKLKSALSKAKERNKKCLLHIEIETGMNRTGFTEKELKETVFALLKEHKENYILKGICTHFAGAEHIANYIRIKKQKQIFARVKKSFEQQGFEPEYIHTCCSAAALRLKNMRFNMVRIGILQYGFWPSQEIKIEYLLQNRLSIFNLKRVLTWKSQVISVKEVKMGSFIGYGDAFRADSDMKIGVVPVGYANGSSRALSNSGTLIIDQKRSLVLGNVNMNSLIIDLRNNEKAQSGDEVILIGSDGDSEISVASFGELSNQLNYELLTRLPLDIPRNRQLPPEEK